MAYQKIRNSRRHAITTRPDILPYTDVVKCIVDHENPKERSFNDSTWLQLATFHPEVFTRAYALKPVVQPLNIEFTQSSKTRYNFNEMLKYWMNEPRKFSQRDGNLYPVTWFREPYSLLEAMLCILYGLLNFYVFKSEWDLVTHHVLTIGKSFSWASILSLELKMAIQDYQKATARKKPNFFLPAFIIDVFYTEFQYPNFEWN